MTLESAKIVGDVVDRVHPSGAKLDVKYKYDHVENGVTLPPAHAASAPVVTLTRGDPDKMYALVMTDPDPPDPTAPKLREWLHWVVTNVPGGAGDVGAGDTVVPYAGPAPPVGTHRYAFLAFEQPGGGPLAAEDPTKGEKMGRAHFSTRAFAKQHGLGDPVAACYFLSHK